MKEPVDHIQRPRLPWRDQELTECGLPLEDVKQWITREAAFKRWKELGQTRAFMVTCVTCAQTCNRWSTWDVDPVDMIRREVYSGRVPESFADELRAIKLLIEAHQDEFDETLAGLRNVDSLDELRRRKARRKTPGLRGS